MSLTIVQSGALTLLQDFGRYGHLQHGLSCGGPMDDLAYLWANTILGNHYNAPQLEITLGGFEAIFTQATTIALCGADLSATLNDKPLSLWQCVEVNAGDTIKLCTPRMGLRCYLAVKYGFDVPMHLGSCATVMRENMGGLYQNGKSIAAGDVLPMRSSHECQGVQADEKRVTINAVPISYRPHYTRDIILRFIPNHSAIACHRKNIDHFIEQEWKVSPNSDRMGYRLSGASIPTEKKSLLSHGVSVGTIQLPPDGQPIVLMKDRQTMGGYPQLGCLAYRDIALLAQSLPGTRVRFTPVTTSDIQQEYTVFRQFFGVDD